MLFMKFKAGIIKLICKISVNCKIIFMSKTIFMSKILSKIFYEAF